MNGLALFLSPALVALLAILYIHLKDQFTFKKPKPMAEQIQEARLAQSQEIWEAVRAEELKANV